MHQIIIDEAMEIHSEQKNEDNEIKLRNKHLSEMPEDVLYHLSLSTVTHDLVKMFSDVKFICLGGTQKRMETFSYFMQKRLKITLPAGATLYDISLCSYRYSMYKIGPVLSVSHGMGIPSLSILLHELMKLLRHAKCNDVTFMRLGTCGGIGVPGGTLVITQETVDAMMNQFLELHVLGKTVQRPAILDKALVDELKSIAETELPEYKTVTGKTMCTYDFYEEQGRLDGAFCDFSKEEKMSFLQKISEAGVINMEMESLAFAAMCHHAGIKGAVVCVALLDRLKGDQVSTTKEVLEDWQQRPQELAAKFIEKRLSEINV